MVDELIKATFSPEDAPRGIIIYVGDRATYVAAHQYHQLAVNVTKTNRFSVHTAGRIRATNIAVLHSMSPLSPPSSKWSMYVVFSSLLRR